VAVATTGRRRAGRRAARVSGAEQRERGEKARRRGGEEASGG
jgi:hypothetical protein